MEKYHFSLLAQGFMFGEKMIQRWWPFLDSDKLQDGLRPWPEAGVSVLVGRGWGGGRERATLRKLGVYKGKNSEFLL